MEILTVESVQNSVPKQLRCTVTQEFVDKLNNLQTNNSEASEYIKENFITYSHVLKEGKYKLESYFNAITYVSFKLMGYTNQDAYIKTFPERVKKLREEKGVNADISNYVAAYSKGKLVLSLLEQAHIPSWLLNQDAYQSAINTLVDLMSHARSEMVRCKAAESLITQLAKPEAVTNTLNINTNESSEMLSLKESIVELAQQQKKLIELGYTAKSIAAKKLVVDVEPEEVKDA